MYDQTITRPIMANKQSIGNRKSVCGVGVNDADYMVKPLVNGKRMLCPYYEAWCSMLKRCYSDKTQEGQPTYIGCSVCKEWFVFSNFRSWMIGQDWEGKQLDKDIIIPGNKVYSPETCCFVSASVNNLLNGHGRGRGKWPQGVSLFKGNNKFRSEISIHGKRKFLGYYDTPEEAEDVYKRYKCSYITEMASEQSDLRIRNGLIQHAELINA